MGFFVNGRKETEYRNWKNKWGIKFLMISDKSEKGFSAQLKLLKFIGILSKRK